MLNRTNIAASMMTLVCAAGACFAQAENPKPAGAEQPKYFHQDFVIKELEDGKAISARHYSMMVLTQTNGSIRTGDKVPVRAGAGDSKYTYIDVGVNIDCRDVKEVQGKLALSVAVDISSAASEAASLTPPLVRNTKWSSSVTLPLSRPTVLFTSDDTTSKRQMQLELTGTPIN